MEPVQDTPMAVGEPIPAICTIEDICRLLRLSESQFFALRRLGTFPIPEHLPRLDRRPRFKGEHVKAYIEGDLAPARRKRSA
jgi:hypothetical protein